MGGKTCRTEHKVSSHNTFGYLSVPPTQTTLQEERWHEANTFPSTPSNKMDIVLSLGKQRLQQPALTAGNPSTSTATELARGADLASLRRSEGSWNPFETARHPSMLRDREGTLGGKGENQGSPGVNLVDCDTPTSSGEGGGHASVIGEAGGAESNRPESGEEDEGKDSMEFHEALDEGGVGLGPGEPDEAKESSGDLRGSRVKDILSVRLAKWQRFRKPKVSYLFCFLPPQYRPHVSGRVKILWSEELNTYIVSL